MTPDDLLRQAQSALTKAKSDGSRARIEVHEGALSSGEVDELQLETELRHALDNEELRLFYQPIVHLADETLLGYEALVRWQHPTRGLLPPAAFLDAAENNRLTSKLGAWVLRRACLDAATWPDDLRVHVNISARHLAEDGFSELVADALASPAWPPTGWSWRSPSRRRCSPPRPRCTRSPSSPTPASPSPSTTSAPATPRSPRCTGCRSTRSRSTAPSSPTSSPSPSTAALVHGLLQLGRGMGLQVIAEGIEDLDQADWLLRHGCAMAQGYAFGRPAPLPSPAEVLIGELTDAPAEDVAGELLSRRGARGSSARPCPSSAARPTTPAGGTSGTRTSWPRTPQSGGPVRPAAARAAPGASPSGRRPRTGRAAGGRSRARRSPRTQAASSASAARNGRGSAGGSGRPPVVAVGTGQPRARPRRPAPMRRCPSAVRWMRSVSHMPPVLDPVRAPLVEHDGAGAGRDRPEVGVEDRDLAPHAPQDRRLPGVHAGGQQHVGTGGPQPRRRRPPASRPARRGRRPGASGRCHRPPG